MTYRGKLFQTGGYTKMENDLEIPWSDFVYYDSDVISCLKLGLDAKKLAIEYRQRQLNILGDYTSRHGNKE
jgi:hypothetical protein